MAGHKNSDTENFGITLKFEARRLLTLNAHEQKQLEKIRKSLDKEKTAEETRLLRAQKEALIHLYESHGVHFAGELTLHRTRTNVGSSQTFIQRQREPLYSSVGRLEAPSKEGKRSSKNWSRAVNFRKVGSDSKTEPSVSHAFFPEMDLYKFLTSGGNPLQRSRIWSSRAKPNLRFSKHWDVNDNTRIKHLGNSTKQGLIQENSKDTMQSENQRRERSLSEILPPAILPPLYSQKGRTVVARCLPVDRDKTLSNEQLWDNLQDCRYIRILKKRHSR